MMQTIPQPPPLITARTTPARPPRRRALCGAFALALTIAGVALSGCAALSDLRSQVSTYSQWPADRKPGSYAFERLPSQQLYVERQQMLEDAARPALAAAGFTPADDAKAADYSVQLGVRVSASEPAFYDDPFWWHGGFYGRRIGYGFGGWRGGWGPWGIGTPNYDREVAVLIRDRKTGLPLYESRATNDGASPSIDSLIAPMVEAALIDFPNGNPTPRTVVTRIGS